MKKLLLLLFCVITVQSRELTLGDAQAYLISNNRDLKIAAEELNKSKIEIESARASLYPSLDIYSSFSYLSELSKIKTTIPMLGTFTTESGQHDRTEFGADISYPVFTGGSRINNIKSKEVAKNSSELNSAVIKNRYSFLLGLTYLRWCLSVEQIAVRQKNIDLMRDYTAQMKVLRDGGVVIDTKVLEIETKLKSAELDYVLAKELADSLKMELLGIAGIDDSDFTPSKMVDAIDSIKVPDSILLSRNELQIYENRLKQLELTSRIVKAQRYPTIATFAGYRVANPGLNSGMDEFMDYFLFGAQLKWNLFDGFKNKNERAQIDKQVSVIKIDKEKTFDSWKRSLDLWKRQIKSADEKIVVAEASKAANEAYVASIENSLKAGVITNIDYETAITNLIQSNLQVEQAKFSRRSALLNALFVSGKEIIFN